ncbi:thiamine diphosphate-binding protein [Suillus subalutaceus]|uniref:thiamine diphosphate-binding protein n=1 Tax=Suillus subalutaceus TaxID=48586 RepID=UPI001B87943B|nr:thiamine diphosphate-binding protein [Suillus subalutaceus]KAG1838453.1 thiamine diphosphate-binding protein [Suillus subalutaceus]
MVTAASVDPLDLLRRGRAATLDPIRYGLDDPDHTCDIDGIIWTGEDQQQWTLENITSFLNSVYVGRIAYDYMDLPSKTERLWFAKLLESQSALEPMTVIDAGRQKNIHALLAKSEVLDNFLQVKFPNLKRYGLEGGESMLPALDALFEAASKAGITQLILAMPHRGRLNLLTGLLEYNPTSLFHKVKGGCEVDESLGVSGDVLSHLVASPTLQYGEADDIKVSLLPNPSHLEAVSPVALGKARAKQFRLLKTLSDDKNNQDCMLGDKLHGDASFTGQGVVMETLGLSGLPHFTSGGSVHIVVNNNIGYTTPASSARSSFYCSDIAKMINCPVLHVNGDCLEDVVRAVDIAFKYRNHFRKDIVIDLIVYRRWGHNEPDEPAFTQPLMYDKIRSRSSVPKLYEDKLISDGVISAEAARAVRDSYKASLNAALMDVASYLLPPVTFEGAWKGMVWPASPAARQDETGMSSTVLKDVGKASVHVPEEFETHPRLNRHVKNRLKSIEVGEGVDWASVEAMAFGSLMLGGCDVRIAGQDVGRGTFSHRHAMLVNQKTEGVIVPLNHALTEAKGKLELANSSLSEMAVLSFEYGASWERPDLLPIWEAQFGDFFNGAQIIIDTFIASSESTSLCLLSGIVLLLPHGLDGAGPEHSSCRIERMLQGLLRLPAASSKLTDIGPGTVFQPVLQDLATVTDSKAVQRVVLLSGKIYCDLAKERATRNLQSHVALIRIEELAPFPFAALSEALAPYVNANMQSEVLWVQEEPRNQGAWSHVQERIEEVLKGLGIDGGVAYRGRKEDAVAAPGIGKLYGAQQLAVIDSAFKGL